MNSHLLGLAQGKDLCIDSPDMLMQAFNAGILLRLEGEGRSFVASNLQSEYERLVKKARCKIDAQLDALERFKREADKLHLHFVLIKGLPMAHSLYGNVYARNTSDIDILVAEDDLPKAHCAALNAEFFQSAETYRLRQLASKEKLDRDLLEASAAPFPIRNSAHTQHLAQYIQIDDAERHTILEIHDSFHLLPKEKMSRFLWETEPFSLEGLEVRVPKRALSFLLLALSLHDDAEGRKENSTNGFLGIGTVLDIHKWISKGQSLCEAARLTADLGIRRSVGEALWDVVQVFPKDKELLNPFFSMYQSRWRMPYLQRYVDPEKRRANAREIISRALEGIIREKSCLGDVLCMDGISLKATCGVEQEGGELKLWWILPEQLYGDPADLVFQMAVLGFDGANRTKGYQVILFNQGSSWVFGCSPLTFGKLDSHVVRRNKQLYDAVVTSRKAKMLGSGNLNEAVIEGVVRIGSPFEAARVLCSMYKRNYASLYTYVCGDSLDAKIEEQLGSAIF